MVAKAFFLATETVKEPSASLSLPTCFHPIPCWLMPFCICVLNWLFQPAYSTDLVHHTQLHALGHHNYREEHRTSCSYCNKRHTWNYPLNKFRKPNCLYKFACHENWEAGKWWGNLHSPASSTDANMLWIQSVVKKTLFRMTKPML